MSRRYYRYFLTFFVVFPMTLLMSMAGTVRGYGWGPEFVSCWLSGWSVMLPIGYVAAFFIIPVARKLADRIRWHD